MEVSSADKIEGAFKEAIKARSAALAVIEPISVSNQKQIADLAQKWAAGDISRGDFVASGGLMSYGTDRAEAYRRAVDGRQDLERGKTRRHSRRAANRV